MLQDSEVRSFIDAYNVMSYFTGFENDPQSQISNTVAAVHAQGYLFFCFLIFLMFLPQGVPKAKIFGGIMGGGQYTLQSATNYCNALRAEGYQTFLWDLTSTTSSFVQNML